MSKWISVDDELPPPNTYVLVHYTGGNWKDNSDQFGCECRIMKFVTGQSKEEKDKLPNSHPDKYTWGFPDEGFNNLKPYAWKEFGPNKFFGQEVDYWQYLTELPK